MQVKETAVTITAGGVELEGDLAMPAAGDAVTGIVVFAHGSGSSRRSPRNRRVAKTLQEAGLVTLLFDLLTIDEEVVDMRTAHLRFDIPLLARRLVGATDWLVKEGGRVGGLAIGYFGASTGAAAALVAAAERPGKIKAVVSRGGRPDLASDSLPKVRAPTLLIVGSLDEPVIGLNREAMVKMANAAECRLEIVQGATHLFEEPGKLDVVARLAKEWFLAHMR
jgi:dienelactone hydrolase